MALIIDMSDKVIGVPRSDFLEESVFSAIFVHGLAGQRSSWKRTPLASELQCTLIDRILLEGRIAGDFDDTVRVAWVGDADDGEEKTDRGEQKNNLMTMSMKKKRVISWRAETDLQQV